MLAIPLGPSVVTFALIPYVMSLLYLSATMCEKGKKKLDLTATTKEISHARVRIYMTLKWIMFNQIR